jgi:hypothetical protein
VTNAITSASSSIITLANCQMLTSALSNVAPVVLSGFYSISNCVYDKTNSTLVALSATGGSTNSIDYFQYINADALYIGSSNANTFTKILKKNTTDNTANVVLTTDGGSAGAGNRLVIPASTTWNFSIQLVAHNDTDHTAASWVFRGCLRRNDSNATSLIESVISENWSEGGMSSTVASVVADDTNEALELRVTGLNSKNIRWVAAVNITQSIL